jgi:putative ABC transport system permease protein
MRSRKSDAWLLVRLAAQNLSRRRLRLLLLSLSVALAVAVGLTSVILGWSIRDGVSTSFSRMGADMIVVPRNTLVNITASLLTVQPTGELMDASMAGRLATIPGVARVAPQRLVSAIVEGQEYRLIAFNPEADFTVTNWQVGHRNPLAETDLLAGGSMPGQEGETVSVCGQPMRVQGRLSKTGVGPFDESYFVTFAALDRLAGISLQGQMPGSGKGGKHDHAAHMAARSQSGSSLECLPGYAPRQVTAFLLQLSDSARPEQVKFAISRYPGLKVVEGNRILVSSRQGLHTLFLGIMAFTALLLVALLILVALLFSAIVQERYREVGLLRAMGAKPGQVMSMILAEAAMITGLGGLGGLVFGATLLFIFAQSLVYYFDSLGVPFIWPPARFLLCSALLLLPLSCSLGLLGALLPAWKVRREEPFQLIHSGGR